MSLSKRPLAATAEQKSRKSGNTGTESLMWLIEFEKCPVSDAHLLVDRLQELLAKARASQSTHWHEASHAGYGKAASGSPADKVVMLHGQSTGRVLMLNMDVSQPPVPSACASAVPLPHGKDVVISLVVKLATGTNRPGVLSVRFGELTQGISKTLRIDPSAVMELEHKAEKIVMLCYKSDSIVGTVNGQLYNAALSVDVSGGHGRAFKMLTALKGTTRVDEEVMPRVEVDEEVQLTYHLHFFYVPDM